MYSLVLLPLLCAVASAAVTGGPCIPRPVCTDMNVASWENKYSEKTVPDAAWVTSMKVKKQQSQNDCEEGETFGFKRNLVWAEKCRADFRVCYIPGTCDTMNLSSWDFKYATETVQSSCGVYSMTVTKQQSQNACTMGETFGFTVNNVWVEGCRADFEICYV